MFYLDSGLTGLLIALFIMSFPNFSVSFFADSRTKKKDQRMFVGSFSRTNAVNAVDFLFSSVLSISTWIGF